MLCATRRAFVYVLPHGSRFETINLHMHLGDHRTPSFIGRIEEMRMGRKKDHWIIWVYSRTGPNGRDGHSFTIPHDELVAWFSEMHRLEEEKLEEMKVKAEVKK